MKNFSADILIYAETPTEKQCALDFCNEWALRTGVNPVFSDSPDKAHIVFRTDENIENKDTFIIKESDTGFTVKAKTIRGLIFGY